MLSLNSIFDDDTGIWGRMGSRQIVRLRQEVRNKKEKKKEKSQKGENGGGGGGSSSSSSSYTSESKTKKKKRLRGKTNSTTAGPRMRP
jgi:hypothetical protein